MPSYEYDKDYPFAAFITNLGKYNEGELVGEWVKFPTTADELKKVFERIGIGQEDDFGNPYEEWFITDYDCYVDGLYDKLGEYANLDELNYLASKLDDMTQSEYEQFQAAVEMGEHTGSIQDFINLTENLDYYDVYPDIESYEDLGWYYIEELGAMQVPEYLQNYIDYEAYGRDVALEEGGEFTDQGYVRDSGSRFYEEYDGDRENIPEEYRIMSEALEGLEPEELTQDELYDRQITESMEVAYEIDTFFRGYHAEYAVMFPDEVVQQIVLHEHLLKGDTAAIKEGLHRTAEERDITDEAAPVIATLESYEQKYGIVSQEVKPQTQADKLDMATDLAFDLDEFFRQHDPQYAAQHPESHEQKELIADLLLEGKTAALRDLLAEMAQTGDDVLPGRLAEYERETGYDPTQDTSVMEDKAKLLDRPEQPDDRLTGERVTTPRGSFALTDLSREQMEAAGYGVHHESDDRSFLIMGNGTRAFAVRREETPEKNNPLKTAEMTVEDDYGMIDGVINNGSREQPKERPSIRERLADAKRECSERTPPEKGREGRSTPEHGDL